MIIDLFKNFICIFSDNDFCVPLSDKDVFKEKLNAKVIILKNKGHFTEDDRVTKILEILDELKCTK